MTSKSIYFISIFSTNKNHCLVYFWKMDETFALLDEEEQQEKEYLFANWITRKSN